MTRNENRARADAAELLLTRPPSGESQAVLWWELITEAEGFSARTGWGLAGTWSQIHRGDYAAARESLDALLADEDRLHDKLTVWVP